jgi:hypothetical protein
MLIIDPPAVAGGSTSQFEIPGEKTL